MPDLKKYRFLHLGFNCMRQHSQLVFIKHDWQEIRAIFQSQGAYAHTVHVFLQKVKWSKMSRWKLHQNSVYLTTYISLVATCEDQNTSKSEHV